MDGVTTGDFWLIVVTVPAGMFVLLVALGIDYSIFLMSRVREEGPSRRAYEEPDLEGATGEAPRTPASVAAQ